MIETDTVVIGDLRRAYRKFRHYGRVFRRLERRYPHFKTLAADAENAARELELKYIPAQEPVTCP